MLVTLQELSLHLNLDLDAMGSGSPEEDKAQQVGEQASDIVVDYLKSTNSGWTEETTPRPVKSAILIIAGALYDDPHGTGHGDYLKPDGAVANLLRRYRDPALA
ncbi:hypothetical protein GCM10007908_03640 [Rhizobium albus]|nr:hypothetical protein GCM10007908_03640 [Rhizobium albus]